ncbi:cystatin-A-like [Ostrea edulis]|uniref:cystatin-A-like n=1 Tax=Ostrea edulis TaxID=37623 RepID=UPI002094D8D5|nr:cystatin-A-like [Ostrea edulis]
MAWISLGVCILGLTGAFAQLVPGGYTETRVINEETRRVAFSVQIDILWRLQSMNIIATEFVPLLYRSQVVAGTNYLVKIRIGYGHHIHVIIYRNLSGTEISVTKLQTWKSLWDPLVPF